MDCVEETATLDRIVGAPSPTEAAMVPIPTAVTTAGKATDRVPSVNSMAVLLVVPPSEVSANVPAVVTLPTQVTPGVLGPPPSGS